MISQDFNSILKRWIKVVSYPLLWMIGTFLLTFIFSLSFGQAQYQKIADANSSLASGEVDQKYQEYLESDQFKEELGTYLEDNTLLILGIHTVIFLPIFYLLYRKQKEETKKTIKGKDAILLGGLGIMFALAFNLFLLILFPSTITSKNIWVNLIGTGILGPIMEEYLFRGVVFSRCKQFLSPKRAIVFTSLLFAVIHAGIFSMIYAFFFSILLCLVKEHYKTIKASILVHIFGNCSVVLGLYGFSLLSTGILPVVIAASVVLFVLIFKNLKINRIFF